MILSWKTNMKKKKRGILYYLSAAGMELCWLHSWTSFLLLTLFDYTSPVLFSVMLYLGGTLTTRFCAIKKRLVVQILLIQTITFFALLLMVIQVFIYEFNARPVNLKINQLLSLDKGGMEWLLVVTLLLVASIIWRRGSLSISKPLDRFNMYHRFDLGITAFILLMVIEFFMTARFGLTVKNHMMEFKFIPFFLFGLLSVGITLLPANDNKTFAFGFHKVIITLVFSVITLAAGISIVLFFPAQLSTTAENVSGILTKAGAPIKDIIIKIAKFLLSPRGTSELVKSQESGVLDKTTKIPVLQGTDGGYFLEIIKWGIIVLTVLITLFFLFLLVRLLLKFLLKVSQPTIENKSRSLTFFDLIVRLKRKVIVTVKRLRAKFKTPTNAQEYYLALAKWGRNSGKSLVASETPSEYGCRLISQFPLLKKEISLLVNLVNHEVYANQYPTEEQNQVARSCT